MAHTGHDVSSFIYRWRMHAGRPFPSLLGALLLRWHRPDGYGATIRNTCMQIKAAVLGGIGAEGIQGVLTRRRKSKGYVKSGICLDLDSVERELLATS
jgi:hypothetical protein